jgi:hypothetical protein
MWQVRRLPVDDRLPATHPQKNQQQRRSADAAFAPKSPPVSSALRETLDVEYSKMLMPLTGSDHTQPRKKFHAA